MALSKNMKRIGAARAAEKAEERESLSSPNDEVLFALKQIMGVEDFKKFFDEVYSQYRWSDYQKYSQLLRDKLAELQEPQSKNAQMNVLEEIEAIRQYRENQSSIGQHFIHTGALNALAALQTGITYREMQKRLDDLYRAVSARPVPENADELYMEITEIETYLRDVPVADETDDEPQDIGQAVAVASGTANLSLNEMSDEECHKWWDSIPVIDPETGEEAH